MLNFSIFKTFLNSRSEFHFSNTNISFFVCPLLTLSIWVPLWESNLNRINFWNYCHKWFAFMMLMELLTHYDTLLQNVTITNWDSYLIKKCHSYYKMRLLLQIATAHSFTYSFKFTYKCFVRLAFHNRYKRY